ncbi:hypothetical protein GCM10009630_42540 [Kribbella jejuensis]|uniref:Uncharacterized protein n=1 Tax=Kribbella jejuensis TaxID=236068 RepID=A0A542EQC3_9ACTN|nr:hypothetical protein [Kribbella jejuensis]TQJ17525.1 hypothetical protein FB475_1645 [Kribbella jejuensis]
MDRVVKTDYGQFDVGWGEFGFDGDADRWFAGQSNGLVGAASGVGISLHFARRSGGSAVRIVLLDAVPEDADAVWEDVVEVSIVVPPGAEVGWSSWAGMGGILPGVAPGSYRVRVSARGRDAGRDAGSADGVLDWYLVELWPAVPAPDAIVRVGSKDAEYWHRGWGSRRRT